MTQYEVRCGDANPKEINALKLFRNGPEMSGFSTIMSHLCPRNLPRSLHKDINSFKNHAYTIPRHLHLSTTSRRSSFQNILLQKCRRLQQAPSRPFTHTSPRLYKTVEEAKSRKISGVRTLPFFPPSLPPYPPFSSFSFFPMKLRKFPLRCYLNPRN